MKIFVLFLVWASLEIDISAQMTNDQHEGATIIIYKRCLFFQPCQFPMVITREKSLLNLLNNFCDPCWTFAVLIIFFTLFDFTVNFKHEEADLVVSYEKYKGWIYISLYLKVLWIKKHLCISSDF